MYVIAELVLELSAGDMLCYTLHGVQYKTDAQWRNPAVWDECVHVRGVMFSWIASAGPFVANYVACVLYTDR